MKTIGTYYPMDGEGRVLNRTSPEHLAPPWNEVIEEVIEVYREKLGPYLHSVWVRGSVASGTAVPPVSDLDTMAFLQLPKPKNPYKSPPAHDDLSTDLIQKLQQGQPIKWTDPDWGETHSQQLILKYPFIRVIEFVLCSWDTDWEKVHPQMVPMMKTQALQVFGDPSPFPGPQPTLSELRRFYRWIKADWMDFLEHPEHPRYMRIFIKTLIRGTFEIFMDREQKYATDFYPCIEIISKYHPEWRASLIEIVDIYSKPEDRWGLLKDLASPLVDVVLTKYAHGQFTDR